MEETGDRIWREASREYLSQPPHNRLPELREQAGLSQAEVAQSFHGGVTPAVISRHEHGEKKLSHEAATQYAEIYGVWSYELFTTPEVPVKDNHLMS